MMMNDITSWDNYSDISDEDDNGLFACPTINETTKKLLLRKYTLYVKEMLNETELSQMMVTCKYKDEEIKKLIDEKINLTRVHKLPDWKSKDNNRKYPVTNGYKASPKYGQQIFADSNANSYLKNYGEISVNNKPIYNRNNIYNFMSGVSSHKPQGSNASNEEHYSNNNIRFSKKIVNAKEEPGEEDDIDHYFNAALSLNNNNISETVSNPQPKKLSTDDIKEFVEEIQKNTIQKGLSDSLNSCTNDTSKVESTAENEEKIAETTVESPVHIEYDLSKFPNVLNANTYSNYFYQTGPGSRRDRNEAGNEPGYANTKMSMKMQPGMQGYYNPMFVPNMGFPVFYPVQAGVDPRMNFNPYFNGMYPPPYPYPMPYVPNSVSSVSNVKQFESK